MRETALGRKVQMAWTRIGARVFRNNVGLFTTDRGTKIRTGLCVGSSDYIGWMPTVITPAMVGKTVAVFVACETKTEGGRLSSEQSAFLEAVRAAGGIAVVAKSEEDVRA